MFGGLLLVVTFNVNGPLHRKIKPDECELALQQSLYSDLVVR